MKKINKPIVKKLGKKEKEQLFKNVINLLNDLVKIRVGVSKIHGVGIIAMRDIKKGDKLQAGAVFHAFDLPYKRFKELRPEVSQLILERWPNVIHGGHFIYPDTNMLAFMNHSDNPNYDPKNDVMLCDVKQGDEITEDYRVIKDYEKIFPWLVLNK